MKKKYFGFIYSTIIVCLIGGIAIWLKNNTGSDIINPNEGLISNNSTTSADTSEMTDEEKETLEKFIDELRYAEENAEYHRGEYPNHAGSAEMNQEFIVDGYTLINPVDGYEIDFLTYDIIPDISDYIDDEGLNYYCFQDTLDAGLINSDGILNSIDYKYEEILGSNTYGEEIIIENYELIAIKLGIRIKNTQNQVNEMFVNDFLHTENLIYLDDDKLYIAGTINYYYSQLATATEPIYHSFSEYETTPKGFAGTHLTFKPLQETEGEVIFILGKQDLNDIYILCSPNGLSSDYICNFNAPYVQFLSFSTLAKLPSKE